MKLNMSKVVPWITQGHIWSTFFASDVPRPHRKKMVGFGKGKSPVSGKIRLVKYDNFGQIGYDSF